MIGDQDKSGSAASVSDAKYFMTGDIGGTNVRLELKERNGKLIKKVLDYVVNFPSFSDCITKFFTNVEGDVKPNQVFAAISIAAMVRDNKAMTSMDWGYPDGNKLKEEFHFKELILLNDFAACGYALPLIDPSTMTILKGTAPPDLSKELKMLIVGPGTGLGVCLLHQRHNHLHVFGSEGSQIGLPVPDDAQFEFEQYARKELNTKGLLSCESICSGSALPMIYKYHAMKAGVEMKGPLPSTGIETFQHIDGDAVAKETFDHFLKMLAMAMASFAACYLPDEGIILCGSILRSVKKHLVADAARGDNSILLHNFANNKCLGSYLRSVPIYLAAEEDLGLKGCWNYLVQLMRSEGNK